MTELSKIMLDNIRIDLQNSIQIPVTSNSKTKSAALCNWLNNLSLKIMNILHESKLSNVPAANHPVHITESHIIFQINMIIRQLYPNTFVKAIKAHARQAYKNWLKQPILNKTIFLLQEFRYCEIFGWTDLYQQKYIDILHEIIENTVEKLCKGEYQNEFLTDLRIWIDGNILPFASIVLLNTNYEQVQQLQQNDILNTSHNTANFENTEKIKNSNYILKLKNIFHASLLNTLSKYRANELFDIVADFPESMPAVKELKESASSSNNMAYVG